VKVRQFQEVPMGKTFCLPRIAPFRLTGGSF
jgi:hypothetical protein